MRTAAIVPLKIPAQAKTRLAGFLSPESRADMARSMFQHVLEALLRAHRVTSIAVISPDPDLRLPPGVALLEQNRDGLNALLEQGREWAEAQGAEALLVIFADLPAVSPGEIDSLIALGSQDNTIVLAPDRHGSGTNAMLANPPSLARFAFGENSYGRHRALAEEAGATVIEYASEGTSLDIDTVDDLALLDSRQRGSPGETPYEDQYLYMRG